LPWPAGNGLDAALPPEDEPDGVAEPDPPVGLEPEVAPELGALAPELPTEIEPEPAPEPPVMLDVEPDIPAPFEPEPAPVEIEEPVELDAPLCEDAPEPLPGKTVMLVQPEALTIANVSADHRL
jgi:hypothetical protein